MHRANLPYIHAYIHTYIHTENIDRATNPNRMEKDSQVYKRTQNGVHTVDKESLLSAGRAAAAEW